MMASFISPILSTIIVRMTIRMAVRTITDIADAVLAVFADHFGFIMAAVT
jgi:hypothetical protein